MIGNIQKRAAGKVPAVFFNRPVRSANYRKVVVRQKRPIRIVANSLDPVNHRHADFQFEDRGPKAIFFREVPGRSLRDFRYFARRWVGESRKFHA